MSESATDQRIASGVAPTGPGVAQITGEQAREMLPKRPFGAHKWQAGGVVLIGGSPAYIGAVALAGMAAQRAGAGVIQLAVPRGIISPLVPLIPEATYIPLPETESSSGARRATSLISERGDEASSFLIGPGLGQDENVAGLLGAFFGAPETIRSIGFGGPTHNGAKSTSPERSVAVGRGGTPLVIDADGLNWLAKQEKWQDLLEPGSAVLTPHPGEMARLLATNVNNIIDDPVGTVRKAAQVSRQVVVLKYGFTLVSDGEVVRVAPAAPVSLASAGTGDVLAGTIAAFLAQGLKAIDAASLAVYLGCHSALAIETRTGSLGLVASDLPMGIANEIANLEQHGAATDG